MSQPLTHPAITLETPSGAIPLKYTVERIPDQPDPQVAATIARMCQHVCQDYVTPYIQRDAALAVAIDPANPLGSIHQFVRSRLRFKRDEQIASDVEGKARLVNRPGDGPADDYFVECLIRPVDVSYQFLATGQPVEGDCDDFSMYCAALLKACGIDCCFATVGADENDPNSFSHVYVVAYWRGQRIPMDCSHGPYAGWETPNKFGKFQEWPVTDRSVWGGLGVALLLGGWFAWTHRREIRELLA